MLEVCPKTPKCPLFNDGLLKRQESADTYKKLYCNSSVEYKNCKRYLIAEKFGKCPPFVLPNSTLTLADIELRMKVEGLLT